MLCAHVCANLNPPSTLVSYSLTCSQGSAQGSGCRANASSTSSSTRASCVVAIADLFWDHWSVTMSWRLQFTSGWTVVALIDERDRFVDERSRLSVVTRARRLGKVTWVLAQPRLSSSSVSPRPSLRRESSSAPAMNVHWSRRLSSWRGDPGPNRLVGSGSIFRLSPATLTWGVVEVLCGEGRRRVRRRVPDRRARHCPPSAATETTRSRDEQQHIESVYGCGDDVRCRGVGQ